MPRTSAFSDAAGALRGGEGHLPQNALCDHSLFYRARALIPEDSLMGIGSALL